MKKIALMTFAVIFSLQLIALTPADPKDRILNSFQRNFPHAQAQTIYDYGDCYMVYFKDKNYIWRIFYDLEGSMISTTKYYNATMLEPYIHAILDEKYAGKEIYAVTEVSSSENHFYQIILQDSKCWYIVNFDGSFRLSLKKKLIKS